MYSLVYNYLFLFEVRYTFAFWFTRIRSDMVLLSIFTIQWNCTIQFYYVHKFIQNKAIFDQSLCGSYFNLKNDKKHTKSIFKYLFKSNFKKTYAPKVFVPCVVL